MKRRKRGGRSVQDLLGIRCFTKYGLETEQGELLFFRVSPINISVLSTENIDQKIHKLQMALTLMPDLCLISTDSCECFDANKAYLRQREQAEKNPQVRELLRRDGKMLTGLQAEMSNARQFVFLRRCMGLSQEQVFDFANQTLKHLVEQGFEASRMGKADIKRFLAIYFGASMDGDQMPDVDGAQCFKEDAD